MTMKPNQKLYVLVRQDLSAGQQLAQATHSVARFVAAHQEIAWNWMHFSEHICVLGVKNEAHLHEYLDLAVKFRIPYAPFVEPDMGNQITSVTLAPTPASELLCSKLKLAGRK